MNISEEEGASLGKREGTGTIEVWKTEQKEEDYKLRCWLELGDPGTIYLKLLKLHMNKLSLFLGHSVLQKFPCLEEVSSSSCKNFTAFHLSEW